MNGGNAVMADDNTYNDILNKLKSGENPTPVPKDSQQSVGTKPSTFGLKNVNEGFEAWNKDEEKKDK